MRRPRLPRGWRRSDYRAPGYVEVFGEAVPLPAPVETSPGSRSIEDTYGIGSDEHHGGCCGPDCDGRCAEIVYARWSWLFGGDAPAYAYGSPGEGDR